MAFSRLMERQTLRNVSKGSGGVIVLDMGDLSFLFVGIGIKNRSDLFPVFFVGKKKTRPAGPPAREASYVICHLSRGASTDAGFRDCILPGCVVCKHLCMVDAQQGKLLQSAHTLVVKISL